MKSIFSSNDEGLSFQELNIPGPDSMIEILDKSRDISSVSDYRELYIILLGSVANKDHKLTVSEIRAYESATASCFDDDYINDPVNRTKILNSILNPCELTDELIKCFFDAINENDVSKNKRIEIAGSLISMLEDSSIIDASAAAPLVKKLVLQLNVPAAELFGRLDALQQRESEFNIRPPLGFLTSSITGRVKDIFNDVTLMISRKSHKKAGLESVGTIRGILNERSIKKASAIKLFGELIESKKIQEAAEDFSSQIQPGDFQIVICGEMKHGKSSIFNLLVGNEISPVGESVATTAASIELYYDEQPCYQGEWISDSDISVINDYFDSRNNDPATTIERENFNAIIESPNFRPGGAIDSIDSKPEMIEFSSTRGRSALAVEKLRVGLPLPYLEKGAVIIDTPGLNDPFQLREKRTLEDANKADCIVFVMRADKFGTNSERNFLKLLLQAGTVTGLVIVITHFDRLMSDDSVKEMMVRAETWFQSVAKEADVECYLGDVQIFGFDARFDIESRASIEGLGYDEFIENIMRTAEKLHASGDYEARVSDKLKQLDKLVELESVIYLQNVDLVLERENNHKSLSAIKSQLVKMTDVYRADTTSRLGEYRARLELDYQEVQAGLKSFKKALVSSLNDAIERKVNDLGDDYALDRKWESFDKDDCELICSRELKDFNHLISAKIEYWENTVNSFSQDEQTRLQSSAVKLIEAQQEFQGICTTSGKKERVFNMLDKGMIGARRTATFLAGYGSGIMKGGGIKNIFSELTSLMRVSWVLPAMGIVALSMWGFSKLIGSAEERKRKFREHKIDAAKVYIDKRMEGLLRSLKNDIYEIDKNLVFIAENYCASVLISAYATIKEVDLRMELTENVKKSEREIVEERIQKMRITS